MSADTRRLLVLSTPSDRVEALAKMSGPGLLGFALDMTTDNARLLAEVARLTAERDEARRAGAPTHSLECPQCGAAVFAREVATWDTDEEESCAGCESQCVVGLDEHWGGEVEVFVYIRSTPTPAEDLDTLTDFFGEPDPARPWQFAGGDPFDAHALVARLRAFAVDWRTRAEQAEALAETAQRERNAWCYGAKTGRWRLLVPHTPDYGDVNEHGESDRLHSDFRAVVYGAPVVVSVAPGRPSAHSLGYGAGYAAFVNGEETPAEGVDVDAWNAGFRDALAHHEETGGEP